MNKGIYLMSCIALVACSRIAVGNQPFKDVESNSWAYDALNQLQEEGIVTGLKLIYAFKYMARYFVDSYKFIEK